MLSPKKIVGGTLTIHIYSHLSLNTISMASALMTSSINALQHHSKIPLGHPKPIPRAKAAQVPNSSFQQSNQTVKSRNNPSLPEFQIDDGYMATKAKKINKALDEAIPLILQNQRLLDQERERVYGTLCIASCELVGGNESIVMPLACATEMFMTMVINRTLLCHAIEYVATKTNGVSPDRLVGAIGEISSAVGTRGILAGRIMEIKSKGKEMNLSEMEKIQRLKIGKFIEASVVSGVLIGGGNEEEIQRLRKYGRCVGLAYQVWNDVLDVGKKDIDKATYPTLMGVDGAKQYARDLVAQANHELAFFDSTRADPLYHMANFAVSRRY